MQMALKIAVGGLAEEVKQKCPFKYDESGVTETDPENISDDDLDDVQSEQANNGGTLGKNLIAKSPGKSGTVGGPFPPPKMRKAEKPQDTKRGTGSPKIRVAAADGIAEDVFPFTVAAHHLIPGNASLKPSDLKNYMTSGGQIKSESGKTWKINSHIGYNVNGCHNGVWLPGNYAIREESISPSGAIRESTSPSGKSWGSMTEGNWQMNYVAAAAKAAGGQFHDGHIDYNRAVEKLLNKIYAVLLAHQETCEDCQSETEVPPPYLIKQRLYNLSKYFKTQLTGPPGAWRRPWFTSDRWRNEIFSGGKVKQKFSEAYMNAGVE